jgi:propanediol dehydratase large subunit
MNNLAIVTHVTAFFMLSSSWAVAEAEAMDHHIRYGIGAAACGEWTRNRQHGDPTLLDQTFTSWMQGYLSAMDSQGLKIRPTSSTELHEMILGYCQQAPELNFEQAVLRVIQGLGAPQPIPVQPD